MLVSDRSTERATNVLVSDRSTKRTTDVLVSDRSTKRTTDRRTVEFYRLNGTEMERNVNVILSHTVFTLWLISTILSFIESTLFLVF